MSLFRCLVVLAAVLGAAPVAAAKSSKEFKAGRLFVASATQHKVLEFDLDGVRRNEYPVFGVPEGVAFGPDGRLYVTILNGGIAALDATGATQTFANPGRSDDLLFGPGGVLLVTRYTEDRVAALDLGNGATVLGDFGVGDLSLDGPTGLRLSPAGRLLVGSEITDLVRFYDLLGNQVKTLNTGGLQNPLGIAFGRDGYLFVSDFLGAVRMYTPSFAYSGQLAHADLAAPRGLAFGPDAALWVASGGKGKVVRFVSFSDGGASGTSFGDPDLVQPRGLAFAPYRLKVEVKGLLAVQEGVSTNVSASATVSVMPGSMRALLRLGQPKAGPGLAYHLGGRDHVFECLEVDGSNGDNLFVQGSQRPLFHFVTPAGSLSLELALKRNKQGRIVLVKSARGTVVFRGPYALFTGKISPVKLLNG